MTTLALISVGALTGALLELTARTGSFDRIVVASRALAKGEAKANNARLGAAMQGYYPEIAAVEFDMYADEAPEQLANMRADVICAAPSMLPWWRVKERSAAAGALHDAPFATYIACHLAPMQALRDAYVASGSAAALVAASAPDVVNAVLARTGVAPVCGIGNVAEVIPKLRMAMASVHEVLPTEVQVRLVAQHAFEYFCLHANPPEHTPPYLLDVTCLGADVTAFAQQHLFTPYPIPYELDFNLVTASSGLEVLSALAGDIPVATHVPAPNGLLGGYPVTVSRAGVELDLAPRWSLAEAVRVNTNSLPFDGIEGLDDDGTIWFTSPTVDALTTITGARHEKLSPSHAPALAEAICKAFA